MTRSVSNVLFLCTGNSARSIFAEAILAREGADRFNSFSAGSAPKGEVHPQALALLAQLGHDTSGFRSKSWDELAGEGAPAMDYIFTVCDNAANEICPIWPGRPTTVHWGIPDPAAVTGSDAQVAGAFEESYRLLSARISRFLNLPLAELDRASVQKTLDNIATQSDTEAGNGV